MVDKKKKVDDFFGLDIDKSTVALGASALSLLIGVSVVAPQVTQFIKNIMQMNQAQTQQIPQQAQLPQAQIEQVVEQPQQPPQEVDDTAALENGEPAPAKRRGFVTEVDAFGNKTDIPVLRRGSLNESDLDRLNVSPG